MRNSTPSSPQFPRFYRLFAALIFQVLLASGAAAFCPRYKTAVNSEFFKSRFVVIGTVISERTEYDTDGFPVSWDYRVRVQKSYRGVRQEFLRIRSENDSGRFLRKKGRSTCYSSDRFKVISSSTTAEIPPCFPKRKMQSMESVRSLAQALTAKSRGVLSPVESSTPLVFASSLEVEKRLSPRALVRMGGLSFECPRAATG
jgi:hypothetical protein